MSYKTVIFDLDGTLLNTLEDLADSVNHVLNAKGLPAHALEAFRYFVGNGAAKLVERALPPELRSEEFCAECLAAFQEQYRQLWNQKTQPYNGVTDLLNALTAQGIPLSVATNKPQAFAELCVKEFLPQWNFAMIVGQRDGIPIKPDPAGPLTITRALGISAEDCLFLGDSNVDMFTAINAGMCPVGAAWGFRTKKELQDSGAAHILDHPADLLRLI